MDERAWCTFRNLVQSVYREARHLGPPGDPEAHLVVTDDRYRTQAAKCRKWRSKLQSLDLYAKISDKRTTTLILRPYREVTGLEPEDLLTLYRRTEWHRHYGGQAWAAIAEALIELARALEANDAVAAVAVCDRVETMWHNSAPLVPSRDEWEGSTWTRQKWPCLCQ